MNNFYKFLKIIKIFYKLNYKFFNLYERLENSPDTNNENGNQYITFLN